MIATSAGVLLNRAGHVRGVLNTCVWQAPEFHLEGVDVARGMLKTGVWQALKSRFSKPKTALG
eukprot:3720127-Lingulodinium_polyedra.AAC.1